MKRSLFLILAMTLIPGLNSPLFAAPEKGLVLEDFDGNAAPGVKAMTEGQLVDVDGNADKEGRFLTRNFAKVIQFDLERDGTLIEAIEAYPVLVYTVAAVPGQNEGSFVQTMVHLATNARGGVYDVFPESRLPISKNGIPTTVRLNLLEAKTEGGILFKDILKDFKDGDGSNLRLSITQQSSRDAVTDCVYDDIRLEAAD
jgi:hypothetical protein